MYVWRTHMHNNTHELWILGIIFADCTQVSSARQISHYMSGHLVVVWLQSSCRGGSTFLVYKWSVQTLIVVCCFRLFVVGDLLCNDKWVKMVFFLLFSFLSLVYYCAAGYSKRNLSLIYKIKSSVNIFIYNTI